VGKFPELADVVERASKTKEINQKRNLRKKLDEIDIKLLVSKYNTTKIVKLFVYQRFDPRSKVFICTDFRFLVYA